LRDDLFAQLAKARRVTKSSLVRESLEKELHEQPLSGGLSCYDLARDLAGTVEGLPKDLADNPKYLEGLEVISPAAVDVRASPYRGGVSP
jgi:hypothetical protein